MDIDRIIQSDKHQRMMPDLQGLHDTMGFEIFVAKPPDTITSNPRRIKTVIKGLGIQIDRHERFAPIWTTQYNNQLFTVGKLVTDLDTKCGHLARAAAASELNLGFCTETETQRCTREMEQLGCIEFEDLYYFLASKTRSLYYDLQVRVASSSITMNTVLHNHGPSSYVDIPCTVRDLRDLLRSVWYHLLHPKITSVIEEAIIVRKLQFLKARPLLPANFHSMSQAAQKAFNERFKHISNHEGPPLPQLFDRLDDISKLSVSDLVDKVYRWQYGESRVALALDASPSRAKLRMDSLAPSNGQGVGRHSRVTFLDHDEEDYIQEEIGRAETEAETETGRSFAGSIKRHTFDGTARYLFLDGSLKQSSYESPIKQEESHIPKVGQVEGEIELFTQSTHMKQRSISGSHPTACHHRNKSEPKYGQFLGATQLQIFGPRSIEQESPGVEEPTQTRAAPQDENWNSKLRRWQSQYGRFPPQFGTPSQQRNSESVRHELGYQSTQHLPHDAKQALIPNTLT
jgi:hypothetical protein